MQHACVRASLLSFVAVVDLLSSPPVPLVSQHRGATMEAAIAAKAKLSDAQQSDLNRQKRVQVCVLQHARHPMRGASS